MLHYRKRRFTAFRMTDLFAGRKEYEWTVAINTAALIETQCACRLNDDSDGERPFLVVHECEAGTLTLTA